MEREKEEKRETRREWYYCDRDLEKIAAVCHMSYESRSERRFGSRSKTWLGSWFELRAFTCITNAFPITIRICALRGNILLLLRSPCALIDPCAYAWLQHAFLAHLSRRLEWAIAVRFRPSSVVRRPSCVVRRASSVVRRPSSVNFLHFHLLLENAWLDFNQTWQESSLGVGDSKLFK